MRVSHPSLALAELIVLTGVLTGCGSGKADNLSGSSTCSEFMSAGSDEQTTVVNKLATQYNQPDFTTPLGAPNVPYFCASHPSTTLDQFFAAAASADGQTPSADGSQPTSSGTPANVTEYHIVVGSESAPTTIAVYDDLACPICKALHDAVEQTLEPAVADGQVKIEYHPVAFLDNESTNKYSSRAMNAALAVLDTVGTQGFVKFRNIAYENQPQPGSPGPSDATLIQWAVEAGANEADVAPLINGNAYHQWVTNATNQMSAEGVNGAPSVFINGQKQDSNPEQMAQAIQQAIK